MLTGTDRILHLIDQYPDRKLQTLMHLVNKTTLKEVHKKQETGNRQSERNRQSDENDLRDEFGRKHRQPACTDENL